MNINLFQHSKKYLAAFLSKETAKEFFKKKICTKIISSAKLNIYFIYFEKIQFYFTQVIQNKKAVIMFKFIKHQF